MFLRFETNKFRSTQIIERDQFAVDDRIEGSSFSAFDDAGNLLFSALPLRD